MKQDMNILLCLNKSIFRQMFVLMGSVYKNNSSEKLCFHVFETDFSESQKDYLKKYVLGMGGNVEIYHITQELLSGLTGGIRIPVEAYLRFFCVNLLPNSLDRVLYLDVDIIVDKSLHTIYHMDFDGAEIAVCKTPLSRVTFEEFVCSSAASKARYNYFNSGVILFNLSMLRDMGCTIDWFKRKYVELLDFCREKDPSLKAVYSQDQGLLNSLFGATAKYLPDVRYNYRPAHLRVSDLEELKELSKSDMEFATIIHYTNDHCDKPWKYCFEEGEAFYPIDRLEHREMLRQLHKKWWDYAVFSPFYFSLKEEADIRTKEYLEMEKKRKSELERHKSRESYLIRELRYLQKLCWRLHEEPNYLRQWVEKHNCKVVAMYARNSVCDLLVKLLKNDGIHVAYIVDDSKKKIGDIACLPKNTVEFPEVDAMIVCDIEHSDEVKERLGKISGFPILSIYDLHL